MVQTRITPGDVSRMGNKRVLSDPIWLGIEKRWFVRLVEKNNRGQVIDAHMKAHRKLPKGSSETKVDIYVNGSLVQVETYDQIRTDVPLDDALLDPLKAGSVKHWFKNEHRQSITSRFSSWHLKWPVTYCCPLRQGKLHLCPFADHL